MGQVCTVALVVALAVAPAGCRLGEKEPVVEADERAESGPTPVTISAAEIDETELTYAGMSGRFRHAHGMSAVPVDSRTLVRVTWPTGDSSKAGDDGLVHAVDLTRANEDGSFNTELMTAFEFEARALAYLPPGATSRVSIRQGGHGPGRALVEHGQVVVYGTSWCGATRLARDYFRARDIDIVFVDVDNGGRRADELAQIGDRLGVRIDRVPIIDVRGRLLVGFEERRLATLLGDRL